MLVALGVAKVTVLAELALDATELEVAMVSTAAEPDETFTDDTLGASIVTTPPDLPALLKVKFNAPVFLLEELPPIVTVVVVSVSETERLLMTSDLTVMSALKPAKVAVVKVLVPATAVSPAAGVVGCG